MNNFEKMLDGLTQKAAEVDEEQAKKTTVVIEELHQGMLRRQVNSMSAFEASLSSALNTFKSDIQKLLQKRSTVLKSQNQVWVDKANEASKEVEGQIDVFRTLMVRSDLRQLREKITPQVQKDIEAKMGELGGQVEELKQRVLWAAGGVTGGMALGMMLLWLSLPSVFGGQAPSEKMVTELEIAELRVILMHGYVMKELYPNLNAKRRSEIDDLTETLKLPGNR